MHTSGSKMAKWNGTQYIEAQTRLDNQDKTPCENCSWLYWTTFTIRVRNVAHALPPITRLGSCARRLGEWTTWWRRRSYRHIRRLNVEVLIFLPGG